MRVSDARTVRTSSRTSATNASFPALRALAFSASMRRRTRRPGALLALYTSNHAKSLTVWKLLQKP